MPVVINEFEVVDEPPTGDATPASAPPAAVPAPLDVDSLALPASALAEAQLRRWSH